MTRPLYLVAAMVLVWILGVWGTVEGFEIAQALRDGKLTDLDAIARSGAGPGEFHLIFGSLLSGARLNTLGAFAHMHVAFPLSIAKALLSSTLVLASTLVLVGRPASRSFAFQALCANALFACLEFFLLRHARPQWIDLAAQAASLAQDPTITGGPVEFTRHWGFWLERLRLVMFELAIPFIAAFALTRPRTKTYFAEVAAAAEGAEEEP